MKERSSHIKQVTSDRLGYDWNIFEEGDEGE